MIRTLRFDLTSAALEEWVKSAYHLLSYRLLPILMCRRRLGLRFFLFR